MDEREKIYDLELAPKLLEVVTRCAELRMPFVASVEFCKGDGGIGRTELCPGPDEEFAPGAQQRLVHMAARCNGNFDKLVMWVMRDAAKHGHSSAYLTILGVKEKPTGAPQA